MTELGYFFHDPATAWLHWGFMLAAITLVGWRWLSMRPRRSPQVTVSNLTSAPGGCTFDLEVGDNVSALEYEYSMSANAGMLKLDGRRVGVSRNEVFGWRSFHVSLRAGGQQIQIVARFRYLKFKADFSNEVVIECNGKEIFRGLA